MEDIQATWQQVGERLSELGLELQLHFEQAAAEGRPEEEDKFKESLRNAGAAIDQAFAALGTAANDEAVRDDIRDVGRSVLDALDAAFSELGERFRSSVKRDSPGPLRVAVRWPCRDRPVSVRLPLDRRFVVDDLEPCYRRLGRAELAAKVATARRELLDCRACPRDCGVNRVEGEIGTGTPAATPTWPGPSPTSATRTASEAGTARAPSSSRCAPCAACSARLGHLLAGRWRGHDRRRGGRRHARAAAPRLPQRGLRDARTRGAQVVEAIAAAIPLGLDLPIVYNTQRLRLARMVAAAEGAGRHLHARLQVLGAGDRPAAGSGRRHPVRAREAIAEMHRQVGVLRFGPDGLARRGVLVRHLVMPGQQDEAAAIFRWLASALSPDTYVNVMGQ